MTTIAILPSPKNAHILDALESGFSLIELVIVLAIMGILGAIILPSFATIGQRAKDQSIKASAQTVQVALETYFLDRGSYPTGTEDIDTLITTLESDASLSTAPINPFTGRACTAQDTLGKLIYTGDSAGTHYTLTVYGHDAQTPLTTLQN